MISTCTSPSVTTAQAAEVLNALRDLDELGTRIYARKGQEIFRFNAAGMTLVAKIYPIERFSQRVAAAVKFSRGRRAYRAGMRLHAAGIRTPQTLMLVEQGILFASRAILVTRYCEGQTLRALLEEPRCVPAELPAQIRDMLQRLREIKHRHGDFHSSNVLVDVDGNAHLIDLDNLKRCYGRASLMRNLHGDRNKLLRSVQAAPAVHEALVAALGAPGTPLLRG